MTNTDIEQINDKLDHIQGEINSLQKQIYSIRASLSAEALKAKQPPIEQPELVEPKQPIQPIQLQKTTQPQNEEIEQDEPEYIDFEKTFGKSWMGAIASVLIFASIIMFATLLIPYLTDVLKMTAMFVVSIAITAVGFYKLRTDAKSHFYLALAGCGIGAVYISLLLSNIYFKMIGDLGLFLLILVWAVLVCTVNRNNSLLFHVIGQLGISIAIITGAYMCVNTKDVTKFLLLVVFFAVSSLLFFLSNIRQTPDYKTIDHAFNVFNLLWLVCGYALLDTYAIVGLIAIAYIAGMLCAMVLRSKNNISFGILATLYGIEVLIFLLIICRGHGIVPNILGILLGLAMLCIAEYKIRNPLDIGRCIIQIVFILIISSAATDISTNAAAYIYIALAFGFMVFGFVRNDLVYKYAGLYNIACVVLGIGYEKALVALLSLVFFAVLFYLLLRLKQQYSCPFKLISHVGLIVAIICCNGIFDKVLDLDLEFRATIIFAAVTIVNIIAIVTIGVINLITLEKEKSSGLVLNIINTVMMVVGLVLINFLRDYTCIVIVIITTLAAFSVNSINLLRRYDKNIAVGGYVGLKYTWLLVTILNALNAPSVMVSISCLLFAIICILIGFRLLIKPIRVYGLALSILSVAKLSLIDINYDNLAGRAAGFFVCGVLCFGISLVYNMIDKKMG